MRARQPSERSDRELADEIWHRGDDGAFRELYTRHTPRLLGFVYRLLGRSGAEAEDIVQEVWIRACEGLDRFRWESPFSTWLLGIGLNQVRAQHRQSARRNPGPPGSLFELPTAATAGEERIDVERAIQLLPDGYRTVLVLHDIEGMKHGEIAERLGISIGTSKSQLFGARRAMRSRLRGSTEVKHA
jgi:RNA polymerase sigma-70 factor (ECF subfamily)